MNKEKALTSLKNLELKIEKKQKELVDLKKQKEKLITTSITVALTEKNIGLEDFFDVMDMVSENSNENISEQDIKNNNELSYSEDIEENKEMEENENDKNL